MPTTRRKKSGSTPTPMPGLVFNEIELVTEQKRPTTTKKRAKRVVSQTSSFKKQPPPKSTPTPPGVNPVHELHKRKRLMWLGVGIFTAIILMFRVWVFTLDVSFLSWQHAPERALVEKSKDYWNSLSNENAQAATPTSTLQYELNKEQIKTTLQNALQQLTTGNSTTPSTTIQNSP
jgi:hypothetical protein